MTTRPALTLITGASAGIGAALAEEFARHGHHLVLVARGAQRLETLARRLNAEYRVQAQVLALDLAAPGAAHELHAATSARNLEVGVLVNNAGVAPAGAFKHMPVARVEGTLRLNVETLSTLSALYLPAMLAAGYGRVLNVASVAGFQPLPSMAVYAASKAYVLALSEALNEELQGSGVRVTALCPGLTQTESVDADNPLAARSAELPRFLVSQAPDVAREGYRACMLGESVRVPGVANQLGTLWSQTQPRWLLRTLGGLVGRQLLRR